jgi:hypothetical protein
MPMLGDGNVVTDPQTERPCPGRIPAPGRDDEEM